MCRLPGKPGWQLVAGAHRLVGAQTIGMELIEAREVSSSIDFRKLREASENLWRRGLDPVGRAAHIAELVRLHKLRAGIDPARDGRVASINARWQKAVNEEAADTTATIAGVYGWDQAVAAELGFSERTVRNDVMLYRRLGAGVVAELRAAKHPILGNAAQLKALAKLEEAQQRRVSLRLAAHGAKTVAEALAQLGGGKPVADPGAKRLSAFVGAFQRMSLAEKKGALAHLAGMLPAEFGLTERGGAIAPVGGAVLSKTGVDGVIAGLSAGQFSHGLLEPTVESTSRANWEESERFIKRSVDILNGARRPE